jgi:hypothetical protein
MLDSNSKLAKLAKYGLIYFEEEREDNIFLNRFSMKNAFAYTFKY